MAGRLVIAAAIVLAGCSRAPDPRSPAPTPQATTTPTAAAIPAEYRGRWATAVADCTPTSGKEAQGLLTIGADAIAFGLTPTTVDRVIVRPGRLAFDTSEMEDGAQVTRRYEFAAAPDGSRLTRLRSNLPDQVYTRCPDRPSGTP